MLQVHTRENSADATAQGTSGFVRRSTPQRSGAPRNGTERHSSGRNLISCEVPFPHHVSTDWLPPPHPIRCIYFGLGSGGLDTALDMALDTALANRTASVSPPPPSPHPIRCIYSGLGSGGLDTALDTALNTALDTVLVTKTVTP